MSNLDLEDTRGRTYPLHRPNHIPTFLLVVTLFFWLHDRGFNPALIPRHNTPSLSNSPAWMDGTESNNLTVVQSDSKVLSLAQSVIAGGLILSIAQSRNISEDIPLLDPWKSAAAMAYILGRTMTGPLERIGAWNWTASGHISVSTPRSTDINHTTVIVRGEIQFRDSNTVKNVTLNFAGIQFVTTNRSIYAFAEQSVRDILVPARHIQNETVSIVKPELTARVARLANLFGDGFIDQYPHLDEKPGARCPFAVSGQLTTVKISDESIQELEYELRIKPSGSSTVWAPLSANVLFLSRECSIMDQIMEAEALRCSLPNLDDNLHFDGQGEKILTRMAMEKTILWKIQSSLGFIGTLIV
ncbi:hypothetical protein C8J56DRAFT_905186 [Mycena floridula]|nr:hypothetical protein C8J56DRAFT_905186 [Mycena floridula]